MDNATRRQLLEQAKQIGYTGSILDVFQNPKILDQFVQEQQQQVQQQPQQQIPVEMPTPPVTTPNYKVPRLRQSEAQPLVMSNTEVPIQIRKNGGIKFDLGGPTDPPSKTSNPQMPVIQTPAISTAVVPTGEELFARNASLQLAANLNTLPEEPIKEYYPTDSYIKQLRLQENAGKTGYKNDKFFPYNSVEGGTPTIAYGHKLTKDEVTKKMYQNGLSEEEATALLKKDLESHVNTARRTYNKKYGENAFNSVPEDMQNLLVDYSYTGTGINTFPNFHNAIYNYSIADTPEKKLQAQQELLKNYKRHVNGKELVSRNAFTENVLKNLPIKKYGGKKCYTCNSSNLQVLYNKRNYKK